MFRKWVILCFVLTNKNFGPNNYSHMWTHSYMWIQTGPPLCRVVQKWCHPQKMSALLMLLYSLTVLRKHYPSLIKKWRCASIMSLTVHVACFRETQELCDTPCGNVSDSLCLWKLNFAEHHSPDNDSYIVHAAISVNPCLADQLGFVKLPRTAIRSVPHSSCVKYDWYQRNRKCCRPLSGYDMVRIVLINPGDFSANENSAFFQQGSK